MLFAVINGILFVLSVVIFGRIWQSYKKAANNAVLRVKVQTTSGEEYRYFTDYGYAVGMLYTFLCALLFLFHIYVGLNPGNSLIHTLSLQQEYYYFLSAVSLSNGFLIIPERSIVLEKYQFLFGVFTIFWLLWPGVLFILDTSS